jgi:thioredoxin 1
MNFEQAKMTTGTVLIEFYASWCPHCQRMMPIVAQVKELLAGQVPVYQYDIDKNQDDAEAAGVESIPTFIIYRNGREKWRQSGEMDGDALLKKVETVLNGD